MGHQDPRSGSSQGPRAADVSEELAGTTPPPIDLATVRAHKDLRDMLAKGDKGAILKTISNLITILRYDPNLTNLLSYNDFTYEALINRSPPSPDATAPPLAGPYPRTWTSADISLIHAYIQKTWTAHASQQGIESAMGAEAMLRSFHPVRNWLENIHWDGSPRLNKWLHFAFGANDTDYHTEVGSKFLIAAVRRVRHPGCKFDYMPVLEGPQGIGKSTAAATLFGADWFSDSIPHDLSNKDSAMALLGIWCLEMAEIEQLIRGEVETIKGFLSRRIDRYRPPFGRGFVSRPRQGILIGTTNNAEYLRDSTGNRRFWPITCKFADIEWISANRDQLWAEAVGREAAGEDIWITDQDVQKAAAEAQADRMIEDVWATSIERFLDQRMDASVTVPELLSGPLSIPVKDQDRAAQMRVGSILRSLKMVRIVEWKNGKTTRTWQKPRDLTT